MRNRRRRTAAPFSPRIWKEAGAWADRYHLVLEHSRPGRFYCRVLEMPTIFDHGRTPNEAVQNVRTSLTLAIATLLERGQRPPAPASAGRRTRQVNLRVTDDEKLLLEQAARRRGFRGISDFLRSVGLAEAREP